ncbi:MAG: deoxyribodipyrimidine photo-lyase, partial [Candidatus Omnitrophica bacterium]|nr:deoxyribodipyrimidine photo-lyase [Candidatus Omnitrophota bacterium]
SLPDAHLQAPWEASSQVLKEAGVELGENYPEPMVDHSEEREKALEAFQKIK